MCTLLSKRYLPGAQCSGTFVGLTGSVSWSSRTFIEMKCTVEVSLINMQITYLKPFSTDSLEFLCFAQWMFLQLVPSWNGSFKQVLTEADAWFAERRRGRKRWPGLSLGFEHE